MNNSIDVSIGILLCSILGGILVYLYHLAIHTSPQKMRIILRKVNFCLGKIDPTLGEIADKDTKSSLPLYYGWIPLLTFILFLSFILSIMTLCYCSYELYSSLNNNQIPKIIFVNVLIIAIPSFVLQVIFIAIVDKIKINVEELQ